MDLVFKENFLQKWSKYFPGAALPMGFYYSDAAEKGYTPKAPRRHRCVIADIAKVLQGKTLCLNSQAIGCSGGKRYFGFEQALMPKFEYFLSCGIPGVLEGERYKKTPDLVGEFINSHPPLPAAGKFLLFKRFDRMSREDEPLAVIFFAPPDVLSGLFTLANYDEITPNAVITPFGAGCASLVANPRHELQTAEPRAVLGMFDVSARPYVASAHLSFAVPWPRFIRMVNNMEESFLITKSWNKVRRRMQKDSRISPERISCGV